MCSVFQYICFESIWYPSFICSVWFYNRKYTVLVFFAGVAIIDFSSSPVEYGFLFFLFILFADARILLRTDSSRIGAALVVAFIAIDVGSAIPCSIFSILSKPVSDALAIS